MALPLPDEVKDALAVVQRELGRRLEGVRWTRPEQLHVTLKFLGDMDEPVLTALRHGLEDISMPAMTLALGPAGRFPPRGAARVLWVGLDGAVAGLVTLAEAVDEVAAGCGLEPDNRPFRAHATLGRVVDPRQVQRVDQALAAAAPVDLRWVAAHFVLVASDLRPEGPLYTVLERYGAPPSST